MKKEIKAKIIEKILASNISIIEKAGEFRKGDVGLMIYPLIKKLLSQEKQKAFKDGKLNGYLDAMSEIRARIKNGKMGSKKKLIKLLKEK